MRVSIRFMSLSGPFKVVSEVDFPSMADAQLAIEAYAKEAGYSDVKHVTDQEFDGFRFTAKTPGGRGGRNIAFGDYVYEESDNEPSFIDGSY